MKVECVETSLIDITRSSNPDLLIGSKSSLNPKSTIELDDRVTLIRGNNGSGKTVIAEALSLIGHASIMPMYSTADELGGVPLVSMQISLSENDVAFLRHLEVFLTDTKNQEFIIGRKKYIFDDTDLTHLKRAYSPLGPLGAVPEVGASNVIQFWKSADDFDLKRILANDRDLAKHLRIRAFGADGADVCNAIRWLIAWNRPKLVGRANRAPEKGPWSLAPRFLVRRCKWEIAAEPQDTAYPTHSPGPVGYFNTDMYDFGSGLDIRESPKEMRSHMTDTLVDRLQIVDNISNIENVPLSKTMEASGQTFPIFHEQNIKNSWVALFHDPLSKRKSIPKIKTTRIQSIGDRLLWGGDEKSHEFMSSGENQAFYALCYIENFLAKDSFIILDEPELHLSIKAASNLIRDIVRKSHEVGSQVFIVTHLPHLFYQAVVDDSRYRLIFLERNDGGDGFIDVLEGEEAFIASSHDSHVQVDHLAENLRSIESPSIWFWCHDLKRFFKREWNRTKGVAVNNPWRVGLFLTGAAALGFIWLCLS